MIEADEERGRSFSEDEAEDIQDVEVLHVSLDKRKMAIPIFAAWQYRQMEKAIQAQISVVKAASGLHDAKGQLARSVAGYENIDLVIRADKLRADNLLAEEERRFKLQKLKDELEEVRLKAEIAEQQAREAAAKRAQEPPKPKGKQKPSSFEERLLRLMEQREAALERLRKRDCKEGDPEWEKVLNHYDSKIENLD